MDRPRTKKPQKTYRSILFWIAAGAIIIALWSVMQNPAAAKTEINFSDFLNEV
jgi:cell division protease FtsH